ncbi:MAG: TIGR00730 family Rossman fold protein [Candidatus Latescibacteria bacterium]|jgi:cytokinin riboside 5'-monophosphate phosphoribohydrolase|nr:TIGR00730 family Rossman fold protein [Candidatus Latescibacterota bacterium]
MNLSLCVFCASSDHVSEIYNNAASELGAEMAAKRLTLIYGGGNNGLMGVLAETVHAKGGKIIGVIPQMLKDMGFAYKDADKMIVTDGMRERKAIMEERAHGFIGLPGGFGTLEEMLEIVTLKQLGVLEKPIVFLNVDGFFDGLLMQFERGYRERFIGEECRDLYYVTDSVTEAVDYIVR